MAKLKFNKSGLALSRRAAAECSVLLKNENSTLPLAKNEKIALFGRNQFSTYKGGGGAADLWAVKGQSFADGIAKHGNVYAPLFKKYRGYHFANYDPSLNKFHHLHYWHRFYMPEVPLEENEVAAAAKACKCAVIFIGRFTIEGIDIKDDEGNYRITKAEEAMLDIVTRHFEKTVLIFNIPGAFDLTFLDKYNIDAVINMFYPGMLAGSAAADILYGRVSPSGKLPFSWTKTADEFPTKEGFATEQVIYSEGIFMGYRYYDSFNKNVVFPFGHGLSFSDFKIKPTSCSIEKNIVKITVDVKNIGKRTAREVVQCYISQPDGEIQKPYQTLCAFAKTMPLSTGQEQQLQLEFDLLDFTSYSEKEAAYILEKGEYFIRVGNSSRSTELVCSVIVNEKFVYKKVKNRLEAHKNVDKLVKPEGASMPEISPLKLTADFSGIETLILDGDNQYPLLEKRGDFTFEDVMKGNCSPNDLAACLSEEQLALLLTGDSPRKRLALGIDNSPLVEGEGTHTHTIAELGIPSSVMQDGPNGVRATTYLPPPLPPEETLSGRDCVCYPSSTALAASWDIELLQSIGREIGVDLDKIGYNGLCAPGVNLHRNMLGGRNFEYYSEDPLLSAKMAINLIKGLQFTNGVPNGRYAVLKHFAFNESEEKRLVSNSIVSERAARELYLRAFEYVLKEVEPYSIMTSYNLVNGTYSSAHKGLTEGICRYEWGYKGWIMTDWSVSLYAGEAPCFMAGCDTTMPGELVTFKELLDGGITLAVAQARAASTIKHLARTNHYFHNK